MKYVSLILLNLVSSGKTVVQTDASTVRCTSRSNIAFTITTPGRLLHDDELDLTIHAVGQLDQTFTLTGKRKGRSNDELTFKMTETFPELEEGVEVHPPIKATLTLEMTEDRDAGTFTATTGRITIDGGRRFGVAQQRYELEQCEGTFL